MLRCPRFALIALLLHRERESCHMLRRPRGALICNALHSETAVTGYGVLALLSFALLCRERERAVTCYGVLALL